jgi:hypothetical protein
MNSLAISISIILLPGLIASVICDKITVRSTRWDAFKYSIYSFLFGVLSYGLLELISHGWQLKSIIFAEEPIFEFSSLKIWSIIQDEKNCIKLSEVFGATLLAPIVALISSTFVNYKVINRIAKKVKVTQKYGDENLFSFFLNAKEVDWVYVRDSETKLTYFGRVVSHSECDSIQEIVLSEVTVHDYETSEELYSAPIIYLSKKLGSLVIEVPQPMKKEIENVDKAN